MQLFYGEIPDDAFYLFVQDISHQQELESKLNTFDWLTLYYIRKGNIEDVYKESCLKLLDMGLIAEDSYFGYVLSSCYLLYKPHVRTVARQYDISHIQTVYYVITKGTEVNFNWTKNDDCLGIKTIHPLNNPKRYAPEAPKFQYVNKKLYLCSRL